MQTILPQRMQIPVEGQSCGLQSLAWYLVTRYVREEASTGRETRWGMSSCGGAIT